MNEDFAQITQCYEILSESSPDPQQIEEASKFLIDFYSQPDSFSFIVNYISSVENPGLQNEAIVGMKMILQNNSDLFQDQETYLSLLNLSIFQSAFVRNFAIIYLSLFNSPPELIIQFVQSLFNPDTEETISSIQIDTCMKLMTDILKNMEEEAVEYIELCSSLSSKAFQTSEIDLLISGAIFRLAFIPFIQDDQDPVYQEYMNSSFQVLYNLLEQKSDSDQIDELIRSISYFIYNNPDSVDYQSLLEVVNNYILTPDISQTLSEQLLLLSDNVLKSCQYTIKEQENQNELILQVLHSYIIYAKKTYDSNNSYDLNNSLIFSTFFKVFYEDQYINEIYSNISSLFSEESSGKFVTLLILDSSFETSSEFYQSKVNEIINIFQISLTDDDFCVRSTASSSISNFCQYIQPKVKFDTIISSLYDCLSASPSVEFLTALTDIFDITSHSDNYFDHSVHFLFQLFESTGDILFRQKIVTCLSSLTKSSQERVCAFFDQIFNAMSQIVLTSTTDEQSATLLPMTLNVLSNMCFTCTTQMISFVPNLLDTSAQFLSEDYMQSSCIKALTAVCQNFPQNAIEASPQILRALFDIASKKVDWEENLEFDDDDDEFAFKGEFISNSSALLGICRVLSIYPDLLVQHFEELFDLLAVFRDHPSGYGTVACASGAKLVSSALIEIEGSDEQASRIIRDILLPLSKGSDYETSGRGFDGLAVGIQKGKQFVTDEIFEAILLALNGHLFFQHEQVTYNESLFDGLYKLLKSLVKMNFLNEIQSCIQIIHGLLLKSEGLKDFALKFFALIINCGDLFDDKIVSELINASLSENEFFYSSFDFLSKLIEGNPESVSEMAPKIIEWITSRVFESDGDVTNLKNDPILIEKSVLLLCSLLQKLEVDVSLFFPMIVQATPPTVLLKKSGKFFEVLIWMGQNGDVDFGQQIAAAVIRLFSEPDNLIEKRNLTQDQVDQLKELLQSLAGSIQNFSEFCAESCDNDEFKMTNLNNHVFQS